MEEGTDRQKLAYEVWATFLNAPKTDPVPILDGRAAASYAPSAD
jgi:hypothetical protein